ncbi:MAG: cbb3-type cytochrome oxidase assembly protein CcoS [Epsilonproteobacteria bacterium]|jgi:cbb3-type cytochrome oxidase maturation protein|nr:cbb3-type cytochrome oxidase assembly protein CcoS [Campylobacterota bacterium]
MSSGIVAMMLGVSTFLGALGLLALLWGLRTGQFDDQEKFLEGAKYDSEDELKDAVNLEKRKKEILEKKKREKKEKSYSPPD